MKSPDVLIVGAGIIGCATAYHLACLGLRVAVLERNGLGSGASGVGAGMLTPLAEGSEGPLLDLEVRSLHLHQQLAVLLAEESGIDVGYRPTPLLLPWFNGTDRDFLTRLTQLAVRNGLPVEWLDSAGIRAADSRLAPTAPGALLSTGEAQVDGYKLLLAYAQAAEQRGVTFAQGEALGFHTQDRQVLGVRTAHEVLDAGAVLVCAGAWTESLLRLLGVYLPITPVRGQLLHLAQPSTPLVHMVYYRGNYLVPKARGYIIAGSTEEDVGFEVAVTEQGRESIAQQVSLLAPFLTGDEVLREVAGLRPVAPDGPFLGATPGWERLYVASGHGRRGILLSAVTGKGMAELIALGSTAEPLEPFAPASRITASAP